MLGDAANSYNPIIQAMIATANLKQRAQGQEAEKEQHKEENAARQKQLKLEEDRIKNEHEHQVAQFGLQAEAAKLAAKHQQLLTVSTIRDLAAKGVDVQKLGLTGLFTGGMPTGAKPEDQLNTPPHVLPQGAAPITNASPVAGFTPAQQPAAAQQSDLSSAFPGPAQVSAQEAEAAGLKKRAESEAGLPAAKELAETQFGFSKRLQDAAHESSQKIAEMGKATQYDIAKMSRETQLAIARMTNNTHLQIAGMGPGGLDSPAAKAMVVGGLTGDIDLDGSNPIEKAAMGSILQAGAKPVGKKDLGVLQQAQRLSPLFDKLEAFADKLPEGKTGAAANKLYQAGANKLFTTDLMNEYNQLKSQLINTGKALEGMTGGRVSVLQMQTDLDSYASLGVTRKQMKDRIQNLKDYYKNNVDELVYKGTSPEQRDLLYKRKGVLPAYVLFAPQTHPDAPDAKLDIEQSLKEGEPVYKRKK